jgi:PASTA domain
VNGQAVQHDGALALGFSSVQARSSLELRFDAGARGAGGAPAQPMRSMRGLHLPVLTGYTPALARRKLAAMGLDSLVLASNQPGGTGRVVAQQPPAGDAPPADGRVRLIVG